MGEWYPVRAATGYWGGDVPSKSGDQLPEYQVRIFIRDAENR